MRRFKPALLGLLALVFVSCIALPALAAQPSAHAPQVKAPLHTSLLTPITEQLGQQLQTLMGKPAVDTSDEQSDDISNELEPTFGTKALNFVINLAEMLRAQGENFVTNFAAMPELSGWYNQQVTDPHLVARWTAIGQDLRDCVGVPLLGAVALELLLFIVRSALRRRRPSTFSGRLAVILSLFALRALPIILFIGLAVSFLDHNEIQKTPRFILLNIIYAIALSRIAVSMLRGFLSPTTEALRLLPIASEQAVYAYRWLSAFSLVIIYGYYFGDLAHAVHVPAAVILAFGNILALFLVVMMITVIGQKRAFIAGLFRGDLSAAQSDLTLLQSLRLWLARNWHVLAIAYLVVGYLIAALGVANGLVIMMRGTLLTFIILLGVRVVFTAADRWATRALSTSVSLHHTIIRLLVHVAVWMLAVICLAAAWGADIPALFDTPIGQRILGSAFSIGVTIIILAIIYEGFSLSVDNHLNRRNEDGKVRASARARTLLPMIRNTLFIIFVGVVGVVALSEVGVNIGPLIAGAGVLGVAVGFGSQTLVKDFLTGLFIVIENTIAVGDNVKIGDFGGVVEALSIRTIRLRDQDGSLHILPFSEVSKLTNMSKDFGFAVIKVGVAYNTDLEHAMAVMRAVGDELQKDPIYKRVILEPTEILGVDQLGDSSITLMARLRTRAGKQWDVRRVFLLRLKQRFDQEKIEIPFPTVSNIHQNAFGGSEEG